MISGADCQNIFAARGVFSHVISKHSKSLGEGASWATHPLFRGPTQSDPPPSLSLCHTLKRRPGRSPRSKTTHLRPVRSFSCVIIFEIGSFSRSKGFFFSKMAEALSDAVAKYKQRLGFRSRFSFNLFCNQMLTTLSYARFTTTTLRAWPYCRDRTITVYLCGGQKKNVSDFCPPKLCQL